MIFDAFTLLIPEKTVANYALLRCKTFIWVCKIFDKFHVCSRQSSTDMYVIYIFEYISSSFFHEIFKSIIVFTNVPFLVQTKDAWSLCTCAVCATGHLLLHPNQSPGQYLWFLLTASTLKVFCAGKFLRLSKPNWSVQTF